MCNLLCPCNQSCNYWVTDQARKRDTRYFSLLTYTSQYTHQIRKVHTLVDGSNDSDERTGREESILGVSAVTWNSAGSVVAVAYAHADHEDWCDHSTSLAVWNVNRRDFDPSKPHQG